VPLAVIEAKGPPAKFFVTPLPAELVYVKGLRLEANMGELTEGPTKIDAEHFIGNEVFSQFVAWVIARHGGSSPELLAEATRVGAGFVHVIDQRVEDPESAIPPEDLLGSFEVRDGQLVRYLANPGHRIMSKDGFMQLSPFFDAKLLEELRALTR
jgi:hypothetical protein